MTVNVFELFLMLQKEVIASFRVREQVPSYGGSFSGGAVAALLARQSVRSIMNASLSTPSHRPIWARILVPLSALPTCVRHILVPAFVCATVLVKVRSILPVKVLSNIQEHSIIKCQYCITGKSPVKMTCKSPVNITGKGQVKRASTALLVKAQSNPPTPLASACPNKVVSIAI